MASNILSGKTLSCILFVVAWIYPINCNAKKQRKTVTMQCQQFGDPWYYDSLVGKCCPCMRCNHAAIVGFDPLGYNQDCKNYYTKIPANREVRLCSINSNEKSQCCSLKKVKKKKCTIPTSTFPPNVPPLSSTTPHLPVTTLPASLTSLTYPRLLRVAGYTEKNNSTLSPVILLLIIIIVVLAVLFIGILIFLKKKKLKQASICISSNSSEAKKINQSRHDEIVLVPENHKSDPDGQSSSGESSSTNDTSFENGSDSSLHKERLVPSSSASNDHCRNRAVQESGLLQASSRPREQPGNLVNHGTNNGNMTYVTGANNVHIHNYPASHGIPSSSGVPTQTISPSDPGPRSPSHFSPSELGVESSLKPPSLPTQPEDARLVKPFISRNDHPDSLLSEKTQQFRHNSGNHFDIQAPMSRTPTEYPFRSEETEVKEVYPSSEGYEAFDFDQSGEKHPTVAHDDDSDDESSRHGQRSTS